MSFKENFKTAYLMLNVAQKKAVDTIDGPVMVIAGPGTGKTQVLALRIAQILDTTDTQPDGILCLTFTNAGVKEMRKRLVELIGPTATKIKIATFHGYGSELIEQYFSVLGYDRAPVLLDERSSVALFDTILYGNEWKYLRPRSTPAFYYRDLKSLISTLKCDDITPVLFVDAITKNIEAIRHNPDYVSSRGATKGQLKKDAEKKLESLARSCEAAEFYAQYEMYKTEHNYIDYNDILTLMVRIAIESEDARANILEQFLYVLIDEHQDSNKAQNMFLEALWGDEEKPNLFVVGDDRQLIYGFSGASLAYFESFKHRFGTATLITLTQNYRSTQTLLDSAEALLRSSLAEGTLIGSTKESHPLALIESGYPRDEIILAGFAFKERIAGGIDADECALLVPKNHQVKTAVRILQDMGIIVAATNTLNLFEFSDTHSLLSIFRIINNPHDFMNISQSLLDPLSGILPLAAHQYLYGIDPRTLSVGMLIEAKNESIKKWGHQLSQWLTISQSSDAYQLIQIIGDELLLKQCTDIDLLRRRSEIVRTLLHVALSYIEQKKKKITIGEYMAYIDRLIEYEESIPLAVFAGHKGVRVLTLHGSKGLEFDMVWIAHMDERSLLSNKVRGFVLPEGIDKEEIEQQEEIAKRTLYVAITRAKRFCTISYARQNNTGADQRLASIVQALPKEAYVLHSYTESEDKILKSDLSGYTKHLEEPLGQERSDIVEWVQQEYGEKNISVTVLNNFFECPWKWYFRSLLQLPEPLTESLHIGNVVHKAIEYVLNKKGNDISNETIAHSIYALSRTEMQYDEASAGRLSYHVIKIVKDWLERYYSNIAHSYKSEQKINYRDSDFVHLNLTGKIDLVEEVVIGEVRVTDWKTGTPKTNAEIDKIDDEGRMSGLLRQLTMYAYLIDGHSHGTVQATESRLVFLEATVGDIHAIQPRKITPSDIKRLRDDILDYDRLLKSGEWIERQCMVKTFGTHRDECSYCIRAKMMGI